MDHLGVDYFFKTENSQRFLYLKIREVQCDIHSLSNLFSEAGEAIVRCSYENICIDLSGMSLVTSTIFGICINIVALAREHKKNIKFRFNSDAMETARLAAFDELVEIEECN
jgi:hypothetical protein